MYKKLTGINSLHGDVVLSILDEVRLSVNCVCNPQLPAILVHIDPGGWVFDLVITEKQGRKSTCVLAAHSSIQQ